MPAAKSNARSNDNDKENASSVSITPSEIVKKWMALNAATPNLEVTLFTFDCLPGVYICESVNGTPLSRLSTNLFG